MTEQIFLFSSVELFILQVNKRKGSKNIGSVHFILNCVQEMCESRALFLTVIS